MCSRGKLEFLTLGRNVLTWVLAPRMAVAYAHAPFYEQGTGHAIRKVPERVGR